MLTDKEYVTYTEQEVNKIWLVNIRQERNELMDRINQIDRLEVNIIKMGGVK